MFSLFDTIPVWDGQANRQADILRQDKIDKMFSINLQVANKG